MGSLFRSEEMVLSQLFLQNEAAYTCVSHLGELGLVQFRDSNPTVNAFQRKFINQVRRCDEMLRKLCYVEKEIKRYDIREEEVEGNPTAPQPKELIDLEATFENLENDLKEVSSNAEALKKTFLELTESKQILIKAKTFFDDQETAPSVETMDSTLVPNEVSSAPIQLGFVTGVILRERLPIFERMLWRVCLGNVFMKQADMEQTVEDPVTGEQVHKVVFILFFQGERLKNRVKKICEGCRATLYPCPETFEDREKMLKEVKVRLEDLNRVLSQTNEHQHRLLVNAAKNIQTWFVKVRKVKAIYHTMNMFNLDVAKECLIAECWCAKRNVTWVQQALRLATEESGSTVPSILNRVETKEAPPSYNVLNKFTTGFQNIVYAYGVANYREVNPAPYTIITFPFLFAVMFGDCGHGLLMALFALWMVLTEKKWMSQKSDNEMWTTMFGGRYIILLMGTFSIYTGLIYNDAYSKSLNIFGSSWIVNNTLVDPEVDKVITLVPDNETYVGYPYPFGIDPIWQSATNKIVYLNSYKMKTSIIFGVTQMLFGVMLSLWNHTYFRKPLNIFCEFIPQILFLMSIFGYLVILIFYKWVKYEAKVSFCAPSLLISLINMFLFSYPDDPCYLAPIYDGQRIVQTILVALAVVCIPWMLLVKPLVVHYSKHSYVVTPSEHEEEKGFGDLFIDQAIHTIEYCLGSISHTASYLRLWALSLAHAQLSEVLWTMVMKMAIGTKGWSGCIIVYFIFVAWAVLTIGILLIMEGLSAFLHALRLHWVEFQSKFYHGDGYLFCPFSFQAILDVELDIS